MAYDLTTFHAGNMAFDVKIDKHTTRIDTVAPDGDDTGPSPKKLLLGTLAACTGMDVAGLLTKMRVEFSDFSIQTKADLTIDHPKVFTKVELIYRIKVAEKHQKKVEKAVKMSKDTYCGISAMLAKNSPINFRIEYL
ncbi:OsmC family protein [Flavilitoribacter nigricans]|uniref:Osmotically inducible protein OsmC n=1 Tax=Flavilitoribacter nigricans (strain ATCC 23147 / DSM 23189 / NBRC 102662 / NCIMB 1420 / SS-2) TaxID=1122177 RepID=A0A2D0NH82_FLAN2|nr:OsmC family protein [Flavilitoribacter nigricans]PHN07746.1 osmotically inducible protein OsmC [Flavilitoribacter nigricans DSM 23189 = NBRC 102662]